MPKDVVDINKGRKKKPKEEQPNYILMAMELINSAYDIRFNTLISDYELNGHVMQDKDYNDILIDCKTREWKVYKDDIYTLVNSSKTKEYNPIKQLIDKYKGQQPQGLITQLCDTVDCENNFSDGNFDPEYFQHFFSKWFVNMIASITSDYPTDNPLMLCMLSETQGIGKTEFFRRLLPETLRGYYQEEAIKDNKDFRIMMAQNILIMDDELDGKTKHDIETFKALTSKKEIKMRMPYARRMSNMRRIATLCGTGNNLEILSDITGNRRILPMSVRGIDNQAFNAIDKDLLFIEGYNMLQDGYDFRLNKQDVQLLNSREQSFKKPVLEEELIYKYFEPVEADDANGTYLTSAEILSVIRKQSGLNNLSNAKLGRILKNLGYEQTVKRQKSVTLRVWWVHKSSRGLTETEN